MPTPDRLPGPPGPLTQREQAIRQQREDRRQQRPVAGGSGAPPRTPSPPGAPGPEPLTASDSGDDLTIITASITFPRAGLWAYSWTCHADFDGTHPTWFRLVAGVGTVDSTGVPVAMTATLAGSVIDTFSEGEVRTATPESGWPTDASNIVLNVEAHFIR